MEKQILKEKISKELCGNKTDLERILNEAAKSLTKAMVKAYDNTNNL